MAGFQAEIVGLKKRIHQTCVLAVMREIVPSRN